MSLYRLMKLGDENMTTIELVDASIMAVNKQNGNGKTKPVGGAYKMTERIVWINLMDQMEAMKNGRVMPIFNEDLHSKAEKHTGPMYGINKALVTFGRGTGLGFKALPIPTEVKNEKYPDKTGGIYIQYYGVFDEHEYATKKKQHGLTAYEEPSKKEIARFERFLNENGWDGSSFTAPKKYDENGAIFSIE